MLSRKSGILLAVGLAKRSVGYWLVQNSCLPHIFQIRCHLGTVYENVFFNCYSILELTFCFFMASLLHGMCIACFWSSRMSLLYSRLCWTDRLIPCRRASMECQHFTLLQCVAIWKPLKSSSTMASMSTSWMQFDLLRFIMQQILVMKRLAF